MPRPLRQDELQPTVSAVKNAVKKAEAAQKASGGAQAAELAAVHEKLLEAQKGSKGASYSTS